MKKKLMAVLTASSVAVMAAGATLAAYAEPEQEPQIKDEDGTYAYGVNSKCLYINNLNGFENWKADTRINRDDIKIISFDNFSDANGGEVPAGAFEGFTSIERVEFKNSISVIGENAFKGCTSLVDVVFQNEHWGSLITIGKSAFEGCTSISQLDFSRTMVGEIGESAFKGCTSISKLIFYSYDGPSRYDSYVTEIGKSAFQGCTGLMDIVFGNALEEIGESAFEGCINLGKTEEKPNEETNNTDTIIWLHGIKFEDKNSSSLETIGKRAFYGCEKLAAFSFPEKVKTIGEYAFANCASLYGVDMSSCNQLTNIEKYAFFNCLSLMEVHFPRSGNYSSGYNSSIPKHTIAEGAFRNCSWLEGVILSPYVGNVAPGAFYKCKKLKYIGYYVNESRGIGTNIKIEIDTEHSTQDPPNPPQNSKSAVDKQSLSLLAASSGSGDSETVTVWVPPEVTAFSYGQMESNEKYDFLNEKTAEMFQEKLAEENLDLTYKGQIIVTESSRPYEPFEPKEPTKEDGSYYSNYEYRNITFKNYEDGTIDEELFAAGHKLWERDHKLWEKEHNQWEKDYAKWEQDSESYMEWQDFVNDNHDPRLSELWYEVLNSNEFNALSNRCSFYNTLFYVTLYNEPTSKDGKSLNIAIPEKFISDVDIDRITRVDGSVDIVNIPVKGEVYYNYMTRYYYDFSIMEAKGYEFTANYLLDGTNRTYRDESDISSPTSSGIYGNQTGQKEIQNYPVVPKGELDDLNPPSSSSEPSTTTSPENPTPPVNSSNPPSPPPTPNTDDPIESDPESSDPESSEPESSEPESSDPESSEPESSEPESSDRELNDPESSTTDSKPEDNPNTGVCFLAPIALVGAATVAVAARRRKMK